MLIDTYFMTSPHSSLQYRPKTIIALVGRPNVGKSTLFNRLTRTRDALVADFPGLTRDRKYGLARYLDREYILIDTGGLDGNEEGIETKMAEQSLLAIQEADVVFMLVDARAGLLPGDQAIVNHLRQRQKIVVLVVNKVDGLDRHVAMADFYQLGFKHLVGISAAHNQGVSTLLDFTFDYVDELAAKADAEAAQEHAAALLAAGDLHADDFSDEAVESNLAAREQAEAAAKEQAEQDLQARIARSQAQASPANQASRAQSVYDVSDEHGNLVYADAEDFDDDSNYEDSDYEHADDDADTSRQYVNENGVLGYYDEDGNFEPALFDDEYEDLSDAEIESRVSHYSHEHLTSSLKNTAEQILQANIKVALVGRPNVGKSTLTNCVLGEERVIVYDMPGTTRDSIYLPLERNGQEYTIIDTAGVRRRGKINETVEKFSVIKTLQAIEDAHVCLLVIDATQGLADQDLSLLSFILNAGRAVVILMNKWDAVTEEQRKLIRDELDLKLGFVNFARVHFISALRNHGIGDIFKFIQEAYVAANLKVNTSMLTKILHMAGHSHQPPLVGGRRVKLKYAHSGGHNPQIIVVHGNQVRDLPESYKKYLNNYYRKTLNIVGSPIILKFEEGRNPYAGKRNKLTRSQLRKKKRMQKFIKKANG